MQVSSKSEMTKIAYIKRVPCIEIRCETTYQMHNGPKVEGWNRTFTTARGAAKHWADWRVTDFINKTKSTKHHTVLVKKMVRRATPIFQKMLDAS